MDVHPTIGLNPVVGFNLRLIVHGGVFFRLASYEKSLELQCNASQVTTASQSNTAVFLTYMDKDTIIHS